MLSEPPFPLMSNTNETTFLGSEWGGRCAGEGEEADVVPSTEAAGDRAADHQRPRELLTDGFFTCSLRPSQGATETAPEKGVPEPSFRLRCK